MFSFKRFWSIFRARNIEFYRDTGALGWSFIFPILMVIGFGYFFNISQNNLYKVAYVGEKSINRSFIEWVKTDDLQKSINKLEIHKFDLVLDFNQTPIKYWMSKTSPKSQIAEKILLSDGGTKLNSTFSKTQVDGKEVPYVQWLLPGLITMNATWMCLWGIGWVIVRQRKLGILKRFQSSPLTAFEYLCAQMSSRILILAGTGILVFALSYLIYPFTVKGSYLSLFLVYILGCLSLCSIGLLFATRSSSDEFVSGFLNFINFPMIFLSEIFFSLEGSAIWIQWLAKLMPLYQMTYAMRQIMNEGAGLLQLLPSIGYLLIFSFIFTLIGAISFKWSTQQ